MPSIEQDLLHIRKAVYGREVREAIADGIEQCYTDVEEATVSALHAVRYDIAQALTAEQKARVRNNIGANEDAVRYDAVQSLSSTQKARARNNIGVNEDTVRYDAVQSLTTTQKARARNNIGVNEDTVRYDTAQTLTAEQKARVRSNIMAAFIETNDEGITIYNASAV